jgi:hypothetical protein
MKTSNRRYFCLLTALAVSLGFAGVGLAGDLEPPGPPGSTMRTLEELQPAWSQKITDASKRFQLVLDGQAVLDKETGLVWERSPDTTLRTWPVAAHYANNKSVAGRKGWRLPTVEELASLVDSTQSHPSLPGEHPFILGTAWLQYWSSTTDVLSDIFAAVVEFDNGSVSYLSKSNMQSFVWCVRGGHGHDAY